MDLETVQRRVTRQEYDTIEAVAEDVRLTFANAKKFNEEYSDVHEMAKVVERYFELTFSEAGFGGKLSSLSSRHSSQCMAS